MPLYDHFHKPLKSVLQWNSFHHVWTTCMAGQLNRHLPPKFFAEPRVRYGIEIDDAALERMHDPSANGEYENWQPTWEVPPETAAVPFNTAADELEVLIYGDHSFGHGLVGAIEVVCPSHKNSAEGRSAFVSKCHGYLQRGIGLVIVDIVTNHHFNLHGELVERIGCPEQRLESHLYATAYRPTGKNGLGILDIWTGSLALGRVD